MSVREINRIITGSNQIDGAGVSLVRVIGYPDVYDVDPFLMLDAFDSRNPKDYIKGFPYHPHRGIETITYLIHGEVEHSDNMGNKSLIKDGGCQWMTAGKAVFHQEMPQPSEWMLGMQVWLNLPRVDKLVTPQYCDIREDMIPVVEEEDCKVKIISGYYKNRAGATQGNYVKATILDVELQSGVSWNLATNPEDTAFIYIFRGEGLFGGKNKQTVKSKRAVLLTQGNHIEVVAQNETLRMAVFTGKPLKEPIAWGGPIVMNTEEEVYQAYREMNKLKFGE